jgi:hypothetical protein
LDTPYDIQAAMSAPAPGSAPTSVPSHRAAQNNCSGYFLSSLHMPVKTLPNGRSTAITGLSTTTAKRSTSLMANMPIISGMSEMPPARSTLPSV